MTDGSPMLSVMGIMAAQRDGYTLAQYQSAIRAAWKVLEARCDHS